MAYLPAGTVLGSPMAMVPLTFFRSSSEVILMSLSFLVVTTRSFVNMSVRVSDEMRSAALSMVLVEAVISTSAAELSAVSCWTRSPDALNCVSLNVTLE